MRSFIKKLAGTMAFTMAVSAVAPAGVVFADDEAFIAMQGGDTMVADITLATGRTVDFRFVGAPANWAELDPTWTSSIPAVADVNAAGIVTAKKASVNTFNYKFIFYYYRRFFNYRITNSNFCRSNNFTI